MVNNRAEPLDRAFAALADPTRRALVATLAEGSRTVGELAAPLPMSLVAVAKHLKVLESAGLLARNRVGRTVRCTLQPSALQDAARWLESYRRFWTDRIDSLHRYLTREVP
jgi:DNA-binding transcriptional ArsR family regulator